VERGTSCRPRRRQSSSGATNASELGSTQASFVAGSLMLARRTSSLLSAAAASKSTASTSSVSPLHISAVELSEERACVGASERKHQRRGRAGCLPRMRAPPRSLKCAQSRRQSCSEKEAARKEWRESSRVVEGTRNGGSPDGCMRRSWRAHQPDRCFWRPKTRPSFQERRRCGEQLRIGGRGARAPIPCTAAPIASVLQRTLSGKMIFTV
jgi:hypothetical protein